MKKTDCHRFSDKELILQALREKEFFACLYYRYESALLRYIKRISNFSDDESYDILQDSFIKIWKNLNDYDPELSFSTWAYRIVYHQTVTQWRKSISYGKNKVVDSRELLHISTPESSYSDENEKKIVQVMNLLPEKYKNVLILKYFEDKNYEEISDILKIPEGTVATHLNRAKSDFIRLAKTQQISFLD